MRNLVENKSRIEASGQVFTDKNVNRSRSNGNIRNQQDDLEINR